MKPGKTDFIIDLETMGQNIHTVPILDASFGFFEWDRFLENPYTFEELVEEVLVTKKISLEDQVKNWNCSFKKSDTKFWAEQPRDVRKKIMPTDRDMLLTDFMNFLFDYVYLGRVDHWWSRSNFFDPTILDRLSRELDWYDKFAELFKHYLVRDTRTWIDAKLQFPNPNRFVPVADRVYWEQTFSLHDSAHDVAADIMRLQTIHRAENDLEQVER